MQGPRKNCLVRQENTHTYVTTGFWPKEKRGVSQPKFAIQREKEKQIYFGHFLSCFSVAGVNAIDKQLNLIFTTFVLRDENYLFDNLKD